MSDAQKPVEETAAAAAAAPPSEPAAASEPAATSDEITSTEAPVPATEDAKAEEKKEPAEPPKPVSEGVLGYKAPGIVNFRYSKRFFWFGEEPVEAKDLHPRNEVPIPIIAWSTHTGKGLLYFSKGDQKAQPIGAIKLADVSDVVSDGPFEFHFKFQGHKHSFQSNVGSERNAWVETLNTKVAEAKDMVESVTNSDGYKEALEKLGKPAASAPAAKTEASPKKSTDKAPEGAKKDGASGSEEETGKKKPIRSVSKKRASFFGFRAKKEEEEEDKGAKGEESKTEDAVAAEPSATAAEPAKTDEPAPAAEDTTEPATEHKETPSKPSKRASIIGNFLRGGKKETAGPAEDKKEDKKEATPAVPAKDTEAPPASESAEAPAEPAEPAEEIPAATTPASASPKKSGVFSFLKDYRHTGKKEETEAPPKADEPAAPATESTPATQTETPTATETATGTAEPTAATEQPKSRRRSSFFDFVKAAKAPGGSSADSETEPKEKSSQSPLPKLQGLFRGKSHKGGKKEEHKEATPPTVEETPKTAPAEPTDAAPAAASKPEETPAAAEPSQTNVVNGAIGDVVPEAVTVGQNPQPVQATA